MPNYAIVKNNLVVNVVVGPEGYASPDGLETILIVNGVPQREWQRVNGKWVAPVSTPKPVEQQREEARAQRDALLKASDWTQVPDAPVDQQAWADYRQALRDVPQQAGFPTEITWPQKP